jgi:predicted permease
VTRSLLKLQQVNLSFEPGQLVVVALAMRPDELSDSHRQRAALDLLSLDMKGIAGVRDITPVMAVPFVGDGGGVDGRMSIEGQSKEERARNPIVNMEVAAPNYFAMLGIPVLRGRSFSDADREGAAPVIIVSSAVARHFWPGTDPIGKALTDRQGRHTVVGVVSDTRYRDLETARPTVYFPLGQWPDVPATLLVRTDNSRSDIAPALRRVVTEANTGVTMVSTSSLETLLDAPRAQPRLNATVFALFGVAAVSLAAIGLFAIVMTIVRQRTRELGIRMALGAPSAHVRNLILARGLSLAVAGMAIGLAGVFAARRLLSALLFEIKPTDGTTLLAVAAMILIVAAVASFLPARWGTRVNPIIALRSEG